MLGGQDARSQRLRRVGLFDRDGDLQDDGAGVIAGVHEMHGAAGDLCAVIQHRLVDMMPVHPLTAEGGQQGGVDVHHPAHMGGQNGVGDLTHVAGEAHQAGIGGAEGREESAGVGIFVLP